MRRSAGILLYRRTFVELEVLLVHPGGPFFANKDVWGIPKGEYGTSEEPLAAAYREFEEETGFQAPLGDPLALGEITQRGGKRVVAWALEGDLDPEKVVSNTFTMPWRGRIQAFPEIDMAAWYSLEQAVEKMSESQQPFLDRLVEILSGARDSAGG